MLKLSSRCRVFPKRSTTPLYMCMYTREGCSLGQHILSWKECTTIRARVANKQKDTLHISRSYTGFKDIGANDNPGLRNHNCLKFWTYIAKDISSYGFHYFEFLIESIFLKRSQILSTMFTQVNSKTNKLWLKWERNFNCFWLAWNATKEQKHEQKQGDEPQILERSLYNYTF